MQIRYVQSVSEGEVELVAETTAKMWRPSSSARIRGI
ncbi:hypothetical protein FHR92_002154 [Fontibacillus solani]|uniref:Uncharacterized protein n=1 Tax=Fontibacillus solani TaxID=1572857 RepID=A0A7W3ST58_9BACL|nr:hypothetical protein [Fontibacillus solani]